MSKELTKQTTNIVAQAQILVINDEVSKAQATEFLSKANTILDELITNEEKITAPLNAAIKAARAPLALPKKMLKETIQLLREKLGAYQTLASQEAALQANKIATKIEDGKISLATGVRKLEAIDTPSDKVTVDSGSLTFRPKEVLKITNLRNIYMYIGASTEPERYGPLNEAMLLSFLQDGEKIPGCEIEIIQVPINRRG